MAWQSTTFRKNDTADRPTPNEAISLAVTKHRSAMSDVIRDAKKLAEERRHMLSSIKDPELKRSASR